MRKLIVWNLVTLDGCFEGGAKWDLWFHELVWGEELEAFSLKQGSEMDLLLFGRVTYEGMAAYWASAEGPIADFMNGTEKVVASRSLRATTWSNSRLLDGDVATAVGDLKQADGKDIFVFGSADLMDTLIRHRLVDEFRLCIVPVVAGTGTPLFGPSAAGLKMRLDRAWTLKTGGVVLFQTPIYP